MLDASTPRRRQAFVRGIAFTAAAILVVAGIPLWIQGGWWRSTAVIGLSLSTALLPVYLDPWYLFILAVDAALIVGIEWMDRPAKTTVGA